MAQTVQRLSAGWTVRGSNPSWGEILHNRRGRLWNSPSLQYNRHRVFPRGQGGWVVVLTTHPHLAPRLKKECSYTFTTLLGLRGLFQGEFYFELLSIQGLSLVYVLQLDLNRHRTMLNRQIHHYPTASSSEYGIVTRNKKKIHYHQPGSFQC